MAIKSSSEVEAQLELARAYGIVSGETLRTMANEIASIRRQLHSLRSRVLEAAKPHAVKPETTNRKPDTRNLDPARPIEGQHSGFDTYEQRLTDGV